MKKNNIINDFINFVKIDSESLNEKKFVNLLVEKFKKLNPSEIYIDNAGKKLNGNSGNLIIKFKGTKSKVKSLMISAHLDTVKPGINIKPTIKNNFVVTDKKTILGADDKVSITAIYHALNNIISQKSDYPPLEIVFTIAEEIGLLGAKNLDYKKIKSKFAYVFDAAGSIGTIVTHAPTHIKYEIKVHGKESHAGINPEKGKNAIIIAAEIISKIKTGKIDELTTANIGRIQGGSVTNTVPNFTEIHGEYRSLNNSQLLKLKNNIVSTVNAAKKKYKIKIDLNFNTEYEKMAITNQSRLIKNFIVTTKQLKFQTKIKSTTGGSDASIFNKNNIETVNVGVEFINPHSVQEKIKVSTLKKLTSLIENLIYNWK
jgi:tripeptide aminopeptidase